MIKHRAMWQEITETIRMLGLQNFVNYERMNLDSNNTIEKLSNYKKFKFTFLIENLLFSLNWEKYTNVVFVTCNGFTNGKEALINSKIYKTWGVVYLSERKNWNIVKGKSKRSQAIFTSSEYHTKLSHFGFAFTTKNVSDMFNFIKHKSPC